MYFVFLVKIKRTILMHLSIRRKLKVLFVVHWSDIDVGGIKADLKISVGVIGVSGGFMANMENEYNAVAWLDGMFSGDGICPVSWALRANSSIRILLCRFHLVRLFWYQVLTWVSVRLSPFATAALSATLRYFCIRNLRSRKPNWACVIS